jgi:hybrid cluster-associated redox disulfide protein
MSTDGAEAIKGRSMIGLRRWVRRLVQEAIQRRSAPSTVPFHAEMTIDEAWFAHPGAPGVFAQHHLPGCDGCSVRFEETLSEAAEAYGIDLERFLHELNNLRL